MGLVHLVNKPYVFRRIAQWLLLFLKYDFIFVYKSGKSHMVANRLTWLARFEPPIGVLDQSREANPSLIQISWGTNLWLYLMIGKFPNRLSEEQQHWSALQSF